jgi:hypothetical protein
MENNSSKSKNSSHPSAILQRPTTASTTSDRRPPTRNPSASTPIEQKKTRASEARTVAIACLTLFVSSDEAILLVVLAVDLRIPVSFGLNELIQPILQ